jgi:UDP-N-acetylmuramate dehydrogenase
MLDMPGILRQRCCTMQRLMHLERDVPMAPLTTLGIGGPARWLARAETVDDVREATARAASDGLPLFILGGGSNLLVADSGCDGLVLRIDLRGIDVESEDEEAVMVRVAAGEPWDDFVALATANRWAGVECLSGIPGLTGATPIQNVGAYGQEVSETVARVEVLERASGRVVTLTNAECGFGYRSSIFKGEARARYVVLAVTLRLRRDAPASIRYPELQKYVDAHGIDPADLRGVRDAVIAIRRRKGMVLDPADPDTRSDGSFFMNPIVPRASLGPALADAPRYPAGDDVKLSAAWLIEYAGFHKGFVHGNVGLSTKHTLAVINRGGGTAAEVVELVRMIQTSVKERFGIEIHPEPSFIGS